MLSLTLFLVVLGALLGAVWYAVANEDVMPAAEKKARPHPISRVFRRLRKSRSSPLAAAPPETEELKSSRETEVAGSEVETAAISRPPAT